MIKLAVFASGNGSNALNLHQYFLEKPEISVSKIYCNNPEAGIVKKAASHSIPCRVFNRSEWLSGAITSELVYEKTDFVILAGFLWLVPVDMVAKFHNRIINIHPSLLPHYGGKGMYGLKVHESVIANGEETSGITIHLVNEVYDKGKILFQTSLKVLPDDTPETLAGRIHALEYAFFPKTVEQYILDFKPEHA